MAIRQAVEPNYEFKIPSETERRPHKAAIIKRMYELASYKENRKKGLIEYDLKHGEQILKAQKDGASPDQVRNSRERIEIIKKNAGKKHILPAEDTRHELKINDNISIFANQSLEKDFGKMKSKIKFDYIPQNEQSLITSTEAYKEAKPELKAEEAKFVCNCIGGCNKNCPCAIMHNTLFESGDTNIHFSCSSACACQGKCNKSFPNGPENGAEAMIHPDFVKGGTLRSRQHLAPGETAAELTGEVIVTRSVTDNNYAFTAHDPNDATTLNRCFSKKKRKRHAGLTKAYKNKIAKVSNLFYSIDPERKSGEGRYLSHSCFGNLKQNIVYSKGLDPGNSRIMMTAVMPIYPQQELTFFYSHSYAVRHLSKTCLCGELCCIRNIDLFPFITEKDIDEYIENLYTELYNNFMRNTKGAWGTRPGAPGTSAQGG